MTTPIPKRGDIWLVEFDPARGAEIQKTRPAVVMNVKGIGRLPLYIVVPVTDWKPNYSTFSWFVRLKPSVEAGLRKESGADAFQVKSLAEDRFFRLLGQVTPDQLKDIAKAIALCVGYT